jgi:hypothetical protein
MLLVSPTHGPTDMADFVSRLVSFILDQSISQQFDAFKTGFKRVTAGNAISLFRPEELELLVRGSDETFDIAQLEHVATYENFASPDDEPTIRYADSSSLALFTCVGRGTWAKVTRLPFPLPFYQMVLGLCQVVDVRATTPITLLHNRVRSNPGDGRVRPAPAHLVFGQRPGKSVPVDAYMF